ncbi:hypothetical protein DFH09DRAFT_1022780 [Mycena vulgaris]|nr:hypothetical protein DFH09DRAFT_1022780 [Mycena vulgaris]
MPQEIVDMVIDSLVDSPGGYYSRDNETLATCALVCRSWVPRTRYHLFSNITLNRKVAEFGELLRSDKCTFTPYVRDISVFRTWTDPSDQAFDKLGKDLKRLKNVTKLSLDGMFHACAPWADFMCGFENVTEFSVRFHLTGNSNCVFGMIHMLPALQQLRVIPMVAPVVFWNRKPPPPSIDIPPPYLTPPRHLHSLKTGGETTLHMLAWLKWYTRLAQIDTLDLSPGPAADAPHLNDFLPRMSATLHHLHLHEETKLSVAEYRFASFIDILDLSIHKNLKTLTVPRLNFDTQDADAYERLLRFILRISAPGLESVVLDFPGAGYEGMQWGAVDAFFVSPAFPRLHTVRISAGNHVRAYFQGKLPLLHESGLLEVKESSIWE